MAIFQAQAPGKRPEMHNVGRVEIKKFSGLKMARGGD